MKGFEEWWEENRMKALGGYMSGQASHRATYQAGMAEQREKDARIASQLGPLYTGDEVAVAICNQEE